MTRGLIVDSFAGGGGASTGIEAALGRHVDIAINHDMAAIKMHKTNHPFTKHYCEDIWAVDPVEATGGKPVDLMWLSPDCKHFSKAKGGKPVDKKIRGLAWIGVKWAKAVRPNVLILENVEEFKTWGPIVDGRPCPENKGKTFNLFIKALQKLGYEVDFRELVAADYGAPTSRRRFFLIARCDGRPIIWPESTHGNPDSIEVRCGIKKPWRTAAEIIDWSIPCPSIFERKRPLCENTLKRIARGLQKFVIDDPKPFIMQAYGGGYTGSGSPVEKPLPTITAVDHNYIVTPFISQYHSYDDSARGQTVKEPLLTLDTSNRYAVIAPYMVGKEKVEKQKHENIDQVQAFLIKYYGQGIGQRLADPLDTITSKEHFGLVTVMGKPYQIVDIGMRMLTPRELFNAQGFPADYIIDHDYEGNAYPKSAQVARVGNSVCPDISKALVAANLIAKNIMEAIDG